MPLSLPAIDLTTLAPITITVPEPSTVPVTVVTPASQDDPQNVPTPPPDSDPVDSEDPAPPDVSVPSMQFPLDEYFPFCVPFDLYALFQKLQGTPVAPSYTFEFTEPYSNTHVVIPVDLSIFNDAMVVVRRAEVALYIVCLAVASRKFYAK